jgi:hypothetical protein
MVHRSTFCCAVLLLTLSATVSATTFRFAKDPFAGTTALQDPGRDIVGGEDFITFDPLVDVFSLESFFFGVQAPVLFVNDVSDNLPATNVNTIVLQNDDVPFAAGIAATRIAEKVTTPGAGFFIYFNSGLDLPRLVFSTDLSDNTADLKILFRMTNLGGQAGRDQLPLFTANNFEITAVPEPSGVLMTTTIGLLAAGGFAWRRKRQRNAN